MSGKLISIVYTPTGIDPRPPDHYARVSLEMARLIVGKGIEGDRKGKGDRHLNLMAAETLAQLTGEGFQTEPGAMGEQLVLSGIDVNRLAPGVRLRIGEQAVVEVAQPRTGCDRFSHIQGKPISATTGRLGVMAKVVAAGEVKIGDGVLLLVAERVARPESSKGVG